MICSRTDLTLGNKCRSKGDQKTLRCSVLSWTEQRLTLFFMCVCVCVRAEVLSAKERIHGELWGNIYRAVWHDSPVGDQQTEERGPTVRSSALHRLCTVECKDTHIINTLQHDNQIHPSPSKLILSTLNASTRCWSASGWAMRPQRHLAGFL